jgi:hypothetical protein
MFGLSDVNDLLIRHISRNAFSFEASKTSANEIGVPFSALFVALAMQAVCEFDRSG